MTARTLMVQGTASSVGKSIMVTALCRILRQDGWNVAPFKAQNMSLNSSVTADGGEMGRAQMVQAEAACVEPSVDMNPILLKPETDGRSQVIVHGKVMGSYQARRYFSHRTNLWPQVTASLDRLRQKYDIVVMEGAGSPAEVNLKDRDLVNMRVAKYCNSPVLLVADIDRGGAFAFLVGTLKLLEPRERELVKGFVINKFRGDISLLEPGLRWLEDRTGVPVAGVVPYFHDIHIAEEDSVALEKRREMKARSHYLLDIAVIGLPHIANFDDFDPLEQEKDVRLRFVEAGDTLGHPDLLVIPGTKTTMADLQYLRQSGLAQQIIALATSGTPVIGICGGYQMLGQDVLDPLRVEGSESTMQGLGLLPGITAFTAEKSTHQVRGRVLKDHGLLQGTRSLPISGYEIHMGQTRTYPSEAPFLLEERSRKPCQQPEGLLSPSGTILGTYLHGLFHNHELRRTILANLAMARGITLDFQSEVVSSEEQYDRLASLVRSSLDMELVYRLMR